MKCRNPSSRNEAAAFSLAAIAAILLAFGASGGEEGAGFRSFTSTEGQSLTAKLVAAGDTEVTVVREDGKEFTLPLARLSEADRAYVIEWKKVRPAAAAPAVPVDSDVSLNAINEAIGQPLFADGNLWENEIDSVAKRLAWPQESQTNFQRSYRLYPKPDYRFLGARPYSAALYGEDDKVTNISIVFANKGDYFGAAGSGERHFENNPDGEATMSGFSRSMDHDVQEISAALSKVLGEPKQQSFGDGEARRRVMRWDWSGHALLLSREEDEFISVAVETADFADKRGSVRRISDSAIRERARGNLERRENGDVVITNLPMVDQGPKGYCVPATVERCMRYFGIPADMYLLAMTGNTGFGGGTSMSELLDEMGKDIKRKGRGLEMFQENEIEIRKIAKFVDAGFPVMWTMFSTEEFNQIANERTKARKEITDWKAWAALMQEAAETARLPRDVSRGHVVLITGYNPETGEIAFSDSWGERFQERWITAKEAEQVSQRQFYVISLN